MNEEEQKVIERVDDFSLSRVPKEKRQPLWQVLAIQIGGFVALSQFMLGAELGYGLDFKTAVLATVLGSVILEVIAFYLGLAGQREGLPTSLLAKWSGFGTVGSALVGVAFAISLIGWFGIQNSNFASGIITISGQHWPFSIVATITGLLVTVSVIFGFKGLAWTTVISLPLFLVMIVLATVNMLEGHSLSTLVTMAAPSSELTLTTAITLVTGNFIIGAIIMPDITRFAKTGRDVFWVTVVGTTIGELGVNVLGVLMAHATGTEEILPIIYQLTGGLGILLVITSTLKINDINLYSASLGFVNFFRQVFKINFNRGGVTLVVGIAGTLASVLGIIDKFAGFLTILGIVFPPIAAIIFIDYYVLKRSRKILDDSRKSGTLPDYAEKMHPVTLLAWISGALTGYFVTWGVQSFTVLVVSSLVYYFGMKLFDKQAISLK